MLKEHGVAGMPLGVDIAETPMILELQRAGIEVRDAQQVMMPGADQVAGRDHAAHPGRRDGRRRLSGHRRGLKPGVRENEIVALANKRLYEMGSEVVEAINAVSGERCNPHPHNFSDRLIRPGDQAYFDIIHVFNGYRTCYYRTFAVGRATQAQHDAYARAASGSTRRSSSSGRAPAPTRSPRVAEGAGLRVRRTRWPRSVCSSATGSASACTSGRSSPGSTPWTIRRVARGHGVRAGDLLPGQRRTLRRAHRGGGRRHRRRGRAHPLPRRELFVANKY